MSFRFLIVFCRAVTCTALTVSCFNSYLLLNSRILALLITGALCLSGEAISPLQIEISLDLNSPDPFYLFVTPSMHLLHNTFEISTQYLLHVHMPVDMSFTCLSRVCQYCLQKLDKRAETLFVLSLET